MGVPTTADKQLAEIDSLAAVVMARLRSFHHSGRTTDPDHVRQAAQLYVDAIVKFLNEDRR